MAEKTLVLKSTELGSEEFKSYLLSLVKRNTMPDTTRIELVFPSEVLDDAEPNDDVEIALVLYSQGGTQESRHFLLASPYSILRFAHQILERLDPSKQ